MAMKNDWGNVDESADTKSMGIFLSKIIASDCRLCAFSNEEKIPENPRLQFPDRVSSALYASFKF